MRYFAGFLAVIAFITLIVLIITHGGSKTPSSQTSGQKVVNLTNYVDKNSEVHLYTDGEINGAEQHRAIEIIVSKDNRRLTVYKGYNLEVLSQQTFSNDKAAYDNFLHALSLSGFTAEKIGINQPNEKGFCATGVRFIYELREDGKNVKRLWSTTCSVGQGNFAGKAFRVQTLFHEQIPNYHKLINGVHL